MYQLSEKEYEKIVNKCREMKEETSFWPDITDIDRMEKDPERFLPFAVFLLEKNRKPETKKEHYSKQNLIRYVSDHIVFSDTDEEQQQQNIQED